MITLDEFIIQNQPLDAKGQFSTLLSRISTASKIVASLVRRSMITNDHGYTGTINSFNEDVQKLDLLANDTFANILLSSSVCSGVASEELDVPSLGRSDAPYYVTLDPLDGSTNVDVNISIGTIFGIYKNRNIDNTMNGRDQVAAGYFIYGGSTQLVLALPSGVNIFTLDPIIGEYVLTTKNHRMPSSGNIYSINEGNYYAWAEPIRAWLDHCKKRGDTARYVGSMVADCHRTLLKGGIFVYPEDVKSPSGKLRVLYEANPMAYIFERAGGMALSTKGVPLLNNLNQHQRRTSVVIGSIKNVQEFLLLTNV